MEANIYVYGEIGSGGVSASYIKEQLDIAKNASKIILHVASQGGEVYEGYTIYNLLRNSGKPIETIIEGFCASIATLVALSGDKVIMNETATFMIHNPFVGAEGDANTLRKVADHLDGIKNELIKVYSKKTGLGTEKLWDMMNSETFLTADQAKTYGFVTEVIDQLKAVARIDISKLNNDMDKKTISLLEEIKNLLGVRKSPKNMEIALEDGTKIMVDTENGDFAGKTVSKIAEDGTSSPLEDGTYKLMDGRQIIVAGGKIETIEELPAEDNEVEDLKAQLAAKDEELASLKASMSANETALNEQKEFADELVLKVENLLKQLPAGTVKNVDKGFKQIKDKEAEKAQPEGNGGWAAEIIKERVRA
jgi:ATP-dependent Clp endopeptidase proteolytic subunit ClpP